MALAIKLDHLVRSGQVKDYAELARLGHVTRARMSQIISLLNLAPDIQEAILFLPKTLKGRDSISSREVIRYCRLRQNYTKFKIELSQVLASGRFVVQDQGIHGKFSIRRSFTKGCEPDSLQSLCLEL